MTSFVDSPLSTRVASFQGFFLCYPPFCFLKSTPVVHSPLSCPARSTFLWSLPKCHFVLGHFLIFSFSFSTSAHCFELSHVFTVTQEWLLAFSQTVIQLSKRIRGTFSSSSSLTLSHCIIKQQIAVQPPVASPGPVTEMDLSLVFSWFFFVEVVPCASAPVQTQEEQLLNCCVSVSRSRSGVALPRWIRPIKLDTWTHLRPLMLLWLYPQTARVKQWCSVTKFFKNSVVFYLFCWQKSQLYPSWNK